MMHYSTNQEGHNVHISYFRAFACLGIVLLHTAFTSRMLYADSIAKEEALITDIICNMLMWCVPGFIMVTGILLLNKNRYVTVEKATKKYVWRIFKALILFQIIYEITDTILANQIISLETAKNIGMNIITAGGPSLLWYLYMLIGLYLMMPFFKKIVDASTDKELNMLTVVSLTFLSVIPLFNLVGLNIGFYIPLYTIYPCYLFIGYLVYNKTFAINKKFGWVLLVLNSAIIIIFTVLDRTNLDNDLSMLWGYSSIFVVLQSIGICELFVDRSKDLPAVIHKILLELDNCSFGIYLIHIIFVKLVIKSFAFNPYDNGGLTAILILVICITIVSYILTKILKCVPIVKEIL